MPTVCSIFNFILVFLWCINMQKYIHLRKTSLLPSQPLRLKKEGKKGYFGGFGVGGCGITFVCYRGARTKVDILGSLFKIFLFCSLLWVDGLDILYSEVGSSWTLRFHQMFQAEQHCKSIICCCIDNKFPRFQVWFFRWFQSWNLSPFDAAILYAFY